MTSPVFNATGAVLNAGGIVLGGIIGFARAGRPLSPQTQAFFKVALGVFAVFFGLRLVWLNVNGRFLQVLGQIGIALLALVLGRLLGRLLRLQRASNRLGQHARQLIEKAKPTDPQRFSNGLNVCAILFCAAPLGIVGAVVDGLAVTPDGAGYFYPLAVKALMDGLAMLGFVVMFGPGAMAAALPVLVFQATITLGCRFYLEPFLRAHDLLDSVNAAGGFMICAIAPVIFGIRRVELADYLPCLVVAPVLTWVFRAVT